MATQQPKSFFCEPMATWSETSRREFWWEREWRHIGNLAFTLRQPALWLCPEDEIEEFEFLIEERWHMDGGQGTLGARCIDPRWGLEQIIAHLAGKKDVTPFEPR